MSDKLISANDLLRFVKDWGKLIGRAETADSFIYAINKAPAVDAVEVDKVAQMFYEFTGDDCPCNYNDNDEWLWNFCDGDHCPGEELECWKLFVKHYGERRDENGES